MYSKLYLPILYTVVIGLVFQGLVASWRRSIFGGTDWYYSSIFGTGRGTGGGAVGGAHVKACARRSTGTGGKLAAGGGGERNICLGLLCLKAKGYARGKVEGKVEAGAERCVEGSAQHHIETRAAAHAEIYPDTTILPSHDPVVYPPGTETYILDLERYPIDITSYPYQGKYPYVIVKHRHGTVKVPYGTRYEYDNIPGVGRVIRIYPNSVTS